jgi:hypothetical protein
LDLSFDSASGVAGHAQLADDHAAADRPDVAGRADIEARDEHERASEFLKGGVVRHGGGWIAFMIVLFGPAPSTVQTRNWPDVVIFARNRAPTPVVESTLAQPVAEGIWKRCERETRRHSPLSF